MKISDEQLKAFIVDTSLVTKDELEKAEAKAAKENRKLGEVLVKEGFVNAGELNKLEAYILGIPFVDLKQETINPEVLKIIPEAIARKHNIVSFKQTGKTLEVAMLDPDDLQTIDFVKKKANLKILPRLTDEESIKNALRQYEESLKAEFGEFIEKESGEVKFSTPKDGETEEESLQKQAQEIPIIKKVIRQNPKASGYSGCADKKC